MRDPGGFAVERGILSSFYAPDVRLYQLHHPCHVNGSMGWPPLAKLGGRRFLWIAHQKGVVCTAGTGLTMRVELSARMFFSAMEAHAASDNVLPDFTAVSMSVDDVACNVADMAYCTTSLRHPHRVLPGCRERLVPSWITENSEAHGAEPGSRRAVPDFDTVVAPLADWAANHTRTARCGWAGGARTDLPCNSLCGCAKQPVYCNLTSPRQLLLRRIESLPPGLIDAHDTQSGHAHLSFAEQVARWRCLVDIRGNGFSARMAVLLHSNRTVLYVRRPNLYTWFEDPASPARLAPWVHYVPVSETLADLEARARYALSSSNERGAIAANALQLARTVVTRAAARQYALEQLLAVVAARASATPALSTNPWCGMGSSQCLTFTI